MQHLQIQSLHILALPFRKMMRQVTTLPFHYVLIACLFLLFLVTLRYGAKSPTPALPVMATSTSTTTTTFRTKTKQTTKTTTVTSPPPSMILDDERQENERRVLEKLRKVENTPNPYFEATECNLTNSTFFITSRDVTESVPAYFMDPQSCDDGNVAYLTLKMDSEKWVAPIWHYASPKPELQPNCKHERAAKNKTAKARCPLIKSRRVLINYASNDCCWHSQLTNCVTGLQTGGFDICLAFNEKGIDADFAAKNCHVLTSSPGAGFWLWKPYIIYRTLLALDDGDYLFYSDSGSKFIRNIESSVMCQQAKLKQDIVVFSVGLPESDYTKEEAFMLMGCTSDECRNTWQRMGTFVIFRKSHVSVRFVLEWLTYAQDWRIISNDETTLFPRVIRENGGPDHRNDQSVLSLLAKKWKLDLWPDPSQWGNIENDPNSAKLKAQGRFKFMQGIHFIDHTRDKS